MNRTDRPYEFCVERGSWPVHGSRAWKISLLAAAGRVSARGGSVRAHRGLVLVLVAAAIPRAARTPASLGAGERDRDSAAPPPAAGAGAPGRSSATDAG